MSTGWAIGGAKTGSGITTLTSLPEAVRASRPTAETAEPMPELTVPAMPVAAPMPAATEFLSMNEPPPGGRRGGGSTREGFVLSRLTICGTFSVAKRPLRASATISKAHSFDPGSRKIEPTSSAVCLSRTGETRGRS